MNGSTLLNLRVLQDIRQVRILEGSIFLTLKATINYISDARRIFSTPGLTLRKSSVWYPVGWPQSCGRHSWSLRGWLHPEISRRRCCWKLCRPTSHLPHWSSHASGRDSWTKKTPYYIPHKLIKQAVLPQRCKRCLFHVQILNGPPFSFPAVKCQRESGFGVK